MIAYLSFDYFQRCWLILLFTDYMHHGAEGNERVGVIWRLLGISPQRCTYTIYGIGDNLLTYLSTNVTNQRQPSATIITKQIRY